MHGCTVTLCWCCMINLRSLSTITQREDSVAIIIADLFSALAVSIVTTKYCSVASLTSSSVMERFTISLYVICFPSSTSNTTDSGLELKSFVSARK